VNAAAGGISFEFFKAGDVIRAAQDALKMSIPAMAAIFSIFSIFSLFFKAGILSWITQRGIPFFSFLGKGVRIICRKFAACMAAHTAGLDHYEYFSQAHPITSSSAVTTDRPFLQGTMAAGYLETACISFIFKAQKKIY